MAGVAMARFLELRGRRVFEALGVLWGYYRGPFFCSLPYELEIDPDDCQMREMMRRHGISCVRFPSVSSRGLASGLHVCDAPGYSIALLPARLRTQIRRGLEVCDVRAVDPDELEREGYQLNLDTMERQHRFDPEFGDPAKWKRLVKAMRLTPGIGATGAYIDGRLSAYCITCQEGGYLHILHQMSRTADRKFPSGHVLDFSVIERAGADPGVRYVAHSFASLLANPGLDQFKRHLGFRVAPRNLAIYLDPRFSGALASRLAVWAAQRACRIAPSNRRLELAARLLDGARKTLSPEPIR